jgi:hypothetical protein
MVSSGANPPAVGRRRSHSKLGNDEGTLRVWSGRTAPCVLTPQRGHSDDGAAAAMRRSQPGGRSRIVVLAFRSGAFVGVARYGAQERRVLPDG